MKNSETWKNLNTSQPYGFFVFSKCREEYGIVNVGKFLDISRKKFSKVL